MFGFGEFTEDDRRFPGLVLEGQRVFDLSGSYGSVLEILEGWDAARAKLTNLAENPPVDPIDLGNLAVRPPVMPRHILQSGANYRKHVIELMFDQGIGRAEGQSDVEFRESLGEMMTERASKGEPYVFLGAQSALAGAYEDITLPKHGKQHDWELELAVVIGKAGREISPDRAMDHVAGYTVANDLTTRDLVLRKDLGPIGADWLRSKNSATFTPVGPWIVPAEFVPDPMKLQIVLKLNGETMQDESTSDMIFDIPRLLSYASNFVELMPGDLLLTGSPAGNGTHYDRFLRPGDVIEAEIPGLGTHRNRVSNKT